MRSVSSEKVRHLLLRGEPGDVLPDAIAQAMDREQVLSGVLRGGGVLEDVVLRANATEPSRKLAGRAHLVALDGSVELAEVSLRAVLARESDRGLETLAGEIVSARVVSFDAHVTVFDDAPAHDDVAVPAPAKEPPPRPVVSREVPKQSAWGDAASASEAARPHAASHSTQSGGPASPSSPAVMPQRPVRPHVEEEHQPVPDAGDLVEHFAFGPCDVVKSEGDRLHLRLPKDQRVKEIALEMLRVTPLPNDGERKRWRLDRKI